MKILQRFNTKKLHPKNICINFAHTKKDTIHKLILITIQ
jgi:hypothetical protein